jgi:transcriptional regulator with XRE-family HTH domain
MDAEQAVRISRARQLAESGRARRIRVKARLSLRELGAAVGVGPNTVLRWERGDRVPRGDAALRYGEVLEQLAGDGPG